jgi:hypothetical protein
MIFRRRKLTMLNIRNLFAVIVVSLLMSFVFVVRPASSGVTPPPTIEVGKTELQASQLIFWYDQTTTTTPDLNRFSYIQVTNAADTPVTVHVQIFRSSNPSFGNPATAVLCDELDFNDLYTAFDTHIYDLSDIVTNDGVSIASVDGTKGFVVVTPINNRADSEAISHQHMFGNTYLQDFNSHVEFVLNAVGRDAVSFANIPPGLPVEDGTVLDGVNNGYIVLQPNVVKFNFFSTMNVNENCSDIPNVPSGTCEFDSLDGSPEIFDPPALLSDIVAIAFQDNYNATFGGYQAQPDFYDWNGVIFDDKEFPVSGCSLGVDCFADVGLNDRFTEANPLLDQGALLCPGNTFTDGWVKLEVSNLGDFTNVIGINGLQGALNGVVSSATPDNFPGFGSANYMYVE